MNGICIINSFIFTFLLKLINFAYTFSKLFETTLSSMHLFNQYICSFKLVRNIYLCLNVNGIIAALIDYKSNENLISRVHVDMVLIA